MRINDIGQQLADIHEDMLKLYGADVVTIHRTLEPSIAKPTLIDFPLNDHSQTPSSIIQAEMVADGLNLKRLKDGWALLNGAGQATYVKPDTSYYFDPVYYPLSQAETIADIAAYLWQPPSAEYFAKLRQQALLARFYRQQVDGTSRALPRSDRRPDRRHRLRRRPGHPAVNPTIARSLPAHDPPVSQAALFLCP